ncbi:TetR/AcrR family transcriptional regulator [Nocardioides ginsengisoli]|uniref:TetR/AcrR family transcriptional regulator n=1 Tax=Nocardioides ginsengisoli TaxID=363868 RepID=A0ABW3VUP5_9ACTN
MPAANAQEDATADGGQDSLPATAQRLLTGAIACFASKGYQASTTRDICNEADLSAGALYVYFESKEHLLFELVQRAHRDVLVALEALAPAEPGAEADLLVAQIRTLTHWHVDNHLRARVAQTELPNLRGDHLAAVRRQRTSIEALLRSTVVAGCESGVFRCADPQLFVRATLSLCIDVIRWYNPGGHYGADDLARSNVDILHTYLQHAGQ